MREFGRFGTGYKASDYIILEGIPKKKFKMLTSYIHEVNWENYFANLRQNDSNWETFHKQLPLCQNMARKYNLQYMVEGA